MTTDKAPAAPKRSGPFVKLDARYHAGALYAAKRAAALTSSLHGPVTRFSPDLLRSIISAAFEAGCEFITGGKDNGNEAESE